MSKNENNLQQVLEVVSAISFKSTWTSPEKKWYICGNCGDACPCYAVAVNPNSENRLPTQCIYDADNKPEWKPFCG